MKYRFRRSTVSRVPYLKRNGAKQLRLMGRTTLRVRNTRGGLPAKNYYAEDMGVFEEETRLGLSGRVSRALRRFTARLGARMRSEPKIPTRTLWRALAVLSSLTALLGAGAIAILFMGYGGSYKEIIVPDLLSLTVNEASAIAPELLEYDISYAKNPDMPQGVIIAQSPSSGVTRRLYRKDGRLKIKLTVSAERNSVILPEPAGASLRELSLALKNAGVRVNVVEEYSSVYPTGSVISASKKGGTLLCEGDTVTLIASKGRETVYASLPDLVGMSEHAAVCALERIGLKAGRISYTDSKATLGTVIAQGTAADTKVPEGSAVDLVISGGIYHSSD